MGDRRKCQTYTASPAEPGGLPVMLGGEAYALTLTLSLFNFSHLGVGACDALQPAGKIAKRVGGYWDPDRFPIRSIGQPTKLPRDHSKAIPVHVDAPVFY